MPATGVFSTAKSVGRVPIVDWLDELPDKARLKCLARLGRLESWATNYVVPRQTCFGTGFMVRSASGINYRVLYFFHGREVAVISHGLTRLEGP